MEALFLRLANLSITASWLVLAVFLMRLIFCKAPKWVFCLLWGLVALRLICPISIESTLSLIPSDEPLPQDILYTAAPRIQSGVGAIDDLVNPVLLSSMAPEPGASVNPTQVWAFVLTWVWVIGAVVMLLYALLSDLLLRYRVATATLLRENIKQSERVNSPFVHGFFRPVIYLPYSIAEADLDYVIAHEQAHICRKDHWWKPVGFILLAVYWFNPLLWASYVLLCRDIEAACDEKVIREMNKEDRQAYSAALLRCSVRHRVAAACPLAFGETGVKGRIKAAMNYKKPAFWIVLLAIAATIAAAICLLTVSKRDAYNIKIVVPAWSEEEFVYSDEEISPTRREITVWAWENLGDTEITLKPVEIKQENAYSHGTYLTPGMPTKLEAEKGDWFKIGVNVQNPTDEELIVVVRIEHIEVRVASKTAPDGTDAPYPSDSAKDYQNGAGYETYESFTLTPGTAYVSWQCLYMNPFSSYISDDSGRRYEIEKDSFFITSLRSDIAASDASVGREVDYVGRPVVKMVSVSKWEWQEFPYTEEEWETLFKPESSALMADIHALYGEILYQPLDDRSFLLLVDGDLLIVELTEDTRMGKYIWSIYSLINETNMGVAQWEYVPVLSSRLHAMDKYLKIPKNEKN